MTVTQEPFSITKFLFDTPVFATQAPFYADNVLFSVIVLIGINLLNVIPKNFSPFSEHEQKDNEKVVKPFNRFFVVLLIASIIGYIFSYMNVVGKPSSLMRTATSGIPGIIIFTIALIVTVDQVSMNIGRLEEKETKAYQNMGFSMVFIFVIFTFLSGFGPVRLLLNSLLQQIVKLTQQ